MFVSSFWGVLEVVNIWDATWFVVIRSVRGLGGMLPPSFRSKGSLQTSLGIINFAVIIASLNPPQFTLLDRIHTREFVKITRKSRLISFLDVPCGVDKLRRC